MQSYQFVYVLLSRSFANEISIGTHNCHVGPDLVHVSSEYVP
jgi:hypothetical protein